MKNLVSLGLFQQNSSVNLAASLAALSYVHMQVHSRGPRWYLSERRFEKRRVLLLGGAVVHLSSSQSLYPCDSKVFKKSKNFSV